MFKAQIWIGKLNPLCQTFKKYPDFLKNKPYKHLKKQKKYLKTIEENFWVDAYCR